MTRRTFLATAATSAAILPISAAPKTTRRVGVIGHTGRGNYGHGLDVVWQKIPHAKIVGVADADTRGLKRAQDRLKVAAGYSDYRRLLQEQRPEFVAVAPRHADQHHDMVLASIAAGAKGLYVEKPFCRTPAEADQILAAAKKSGAKIAVAHRNRYHPALPIIDQLIAAGKIGRLLEIRGHGLGDRRGGGEDLWVLGTHIFNLFHYFAGTPQSCSATILRKGKPVTAQDVKPGNEGLGPLAGDEIHARWHMENGLLASYTTFPNDGSNKTGYATHLIGTEGTISIHIDRRPVAWLSPGNPFNPTSRTKPRIPINSTGLGKDETDQLLIDSVHNHVRAVNDLVAAVDEDRAPLCDGKQGAVTVEMICGVFESHRQGGAHVAFPLKERGNALTRL